MFENLRGSKKLRDRLSFTNDILSVINNLTTLLGNISAGLVTLFAVVGTVGSIGGSTRGTSLINVSQTPFALRLVILLAIAAALGWGLAALVSKLISRLNETLDLMAYIVSIMAGGLLVFSSDWLSLPSQTARLPELPLMALIGMGTALWLAAFRFRATAGYGGRDLLDERAKSLLFFAATILVVLLLTLAGQGQ